MVKGMDREDVSGKTASPPTIFLMQGAENVPHLNCKRICENCLVNVKKEEFFAKKKLRENVVVIYFYCWRRT